MILFHNRETIKLTELKKTGKTMKKTKANLFLSVFTVYAFLSTNLIYAVDLKNRLGVGVTNQLINQLPALSVKIQRSDLFAYGGILGLKSSEVNGGFSAGLKLYRNIFREPNLTFYGAILGALVNSKTIYSSSTGFQLDATLGSEFHLQGLDSIGFSFEFGASINKLNDSFSIGTAGYHFINAAIHFYL